MKTINKLRLSKQTIALLLALIMGFGHVMLASASENVLDADLAGNIISGTEQGNTQETGDPESEDDPEPNPPVETDEGEPETETPGTPELQGAPLDPMQNKGLMIEPLAAPLAGGLSNINISATVTKSTFVHSETTRLDVEMSLINEALGGFYNGLQIPITLPTFLVPNNLAGVIKDSPYLTAYTYDAATGIITFTVGNIAAGVNVVNMGFFVMLTVDTTGYEGGGTGTITIGSTTITVNVGDTGGSGSGDSWVKKGLFSNYKPGVTAGEAYVVEDRTKPLVYSINAKIDKFTAAEIEDGLHSQLVLCKPNGDTTGELKDFIMLLGPAGVAKAYGAPFPEGITAAPFGNGFKLKFTGAEIAGLPVTAVLEGSENYLYGPIENLTVRYAAKLKNTSYNGSISNSVSLTVDSTIKGTDSTEVLTYDTYALSVRKAIIEGEAEKSSIVIDESNATLKFRISLQQFGNGIASHPDSKVFVTDNLANCFSINTLSPSSEPFKLVESGSSIVKVVKNGTGTIPQGVYNLDFTVNVDMDKILRGTRRENRLSDDTVVYIYRKAELLIKKAWNDGSGTKGNVTFELRDGNTVIASATLLEGSAEASMKFSHETPNLKSGTHTYYLYEAVSETSSYSSAVPIPITITKGTENITFASSDSRMVIQASLGAYAEANFTNEKDSGVGSLKFIKKGKDGSTSVNITGGTFELYKVGGGGAQDTIVGLTVNGSNYEFGGTLTTFTVTSTSGVLINKLPYGTYYVKEVAAPLGYTISGNGKTGNVELKKTQKDKTAELTNTLFRGKISIIKKDQQNNTLDAIEFTLYKKENNNYQKILTGTTANGGKLEFTELLKGEYALQETQKTGYSGYFEKVNFIIDENGEAAVTSSVGVDGTITGGTSGKTITATWLNNKLFGSIKIIKTDAQSEGGSPTYLKGAQFALYTSQNATEPLQGPFTTDANGEVEFTNLPYGTYWVKELSAPEGYVVNVNNNRQAVLQAALLTQTWTNAPKKGEIKVIKKDAEAADKPLSGAVFELLSEVGIIRELTSNAQGKITFSDLAAGSYILREKQAPAGYIKSDEQRTFVIGEQNNASFIWEHTAEYTNARIKKTLRITKVDESGEKQQGAKFKLTGTDLAGKAITQEATTGSDGIAAFTNVPYGSYTITETLAPAGYALLAPVTAIVNAASTGEVIELSAVNKPYVLKVRKTDKGAGGQALALAGAEFNILAGSSYVVAVKLADGSYKYTGTASSQSDATSFATAGAEGSFTVTHLIANTYTLKETKAPEGYVLINETQNVTVSGTTALYERTFTNANIKGKLELLKVDGSDKRLEGIKFTITGASGTFVETTDRDGRITLNDLLFGEYSIVEDALTAPKGMVIEDDLKVNISENGATVKYSIVNRLITGNVKLNKTDTNGKALSGASFLLTPVDENGSVISNSVYYASSNSFGIAEFKNIPYGVYALTETFPPIGFAPSDIIRYVRIGDAPVSGSIINSLVEDNENITLVNSPLLGALKLLKKDGKGNELGGAEFALYKKQGTELLPVALKVLTGEGAGRFKYDGLGSEPTHFGTNAAGEAHIGVIPYGEYEVHEVSAPEGYAPGIEKAFTIMNSGSEVSITMVNEEILGSIMVEKADINDPTKLLIGAQIHVYKRNEAGEPINSLGEPIANGEFLANTPLFSAATGLDGRALISSIPLGKYVAVEVAPPQGYELDGERVQPFDITAENAQKSPYALKLTFKNTPSQYSLKIYKAEKGKGFVLGNESLNGARFLVTNSATGFSRVVETGKVFAMLVKEIDGSPVYTEEVTDGEAGIALLLGIPKGNYKVRELTPPEGFAADIDEHSVTVNTHGAAAEITIENTLVLGSVKLIKLDEAGEPLEGAMFELRDAKNNVITLRKGTVSDGYDYMLDAAGSITTLYAGELTIGGLIAGTYKLVETKAPDGYVRLDEERVFTIDAGNFESTFEVRITNVKRQTAVSILKVDAANHSLHLGGAKFELSRRQQNNTHILVDTRFTDSSGYAIFTGLEMGTYRISEAAAPSGYKLWANPIDFTVDAEGNVFVGAAGTPLERVEDNVFKATIVNHLITRDFAVEKISSQTGEPLSNAVFELNGMGKTYTLTTGALGRSSAITLPLGSYTLRELSAPLGYKLLQSTYSILVEEQGVLAGGRLLPTSGGVFTLRVENTPLERYMVLSKVDANTGAALSGAQFRVVKRETSERFTLTTDSSGLTSIASLTAGIYDIVELSAPTGYLRPLQGWALTISASGSYTLNGSGATAFYNNQNVLVVRIANTKGGGGGDNGERIPLGPGIAKTGQGDISGTLLLGGLAMLFALIALLLFYALGDDRRRLSRI